MTTTMHITIHTNNKSDEFLDFLLWCTDNGYKVTVKPTESITQPISHEQVEVAKINYACN